jgi:pyruvate-ferredoxin/flavodoxin oxidoreductase
MFVLTQLSVRSSSMLKSRRVPVSMIRLKAVGKAFRWYDIPYQVDVLDCLGCNNCADVCPGNPKKGGKALTMVPLEGQLAKQPTGNTALTT